MPRKQKTIETPAGLPEHYTKLLESLAELGEPMPIGDRHPTVTRLREALAQPPRTKVTAGTLPGYIQGLAIVKVYLVDTTHAYWQINGEYNSLMLPEWAREIMRGHRPIALVDAPEYTA